jgi:hypothetical protein
VLLTGDDEGGTKASFDRRPRGRQNGFLNSASSSESWEGIASPFCSTERLRSLPTSLACCTSRSMSVARGSNHSPELEPVGIDVDYSKIPPT